MDDGFFQLLFFGVLILATVFDAMTRGRRRRRRMEEMEREEDEAGEASAGIETTGERETADSMVPDDLWAVLTGQEPPQEREKFPTASQEQEPTPLPDLIPEGRPPPEPELPLKTGVSVPVLRDPYRVSEPGTRMPIAARGPGRPMGELTRKRRGSGYAELLRSGGADSLRRAIVLKEVLGSPAAFRAPGWGWEEQ